MHSSSRAFAAPSDVARRGGPAVGQQDGDPPSCEGALELPAGHPQGTHQVRGAEPAEGEDVGDHPVGRLGDVLGFGHDDVGAEGQDAVVGRGAKGDGGRRHGRRRQRAAAHRPAAIHQQAHGRARLAPSPDPQAFRVGRARRRPRLGDRLHAGVEIEVTAVGPEGLAGDPADAPLTGSAPAADVDHDLAGQAPRQLPQLRVGGPGQIRQQRQRLVGVILHEALEGLLVEVPDLGRDLLEVLVAAQLPAGGRAPGGFGHRLVGRRPLPHEGELVAPFGAPAFPWPSPSARRPKTSAHNSVTISSAVRDDALAQADPAGQGDHGGVQPHAGVGHRQPAQLRRGWRRRRWRRSLLAPTSRCGPRDGSGSAGPARRACPATPGRPRPRRPPRPR